MTTVVLKSLQQAKRLVIVVTGFTILLAGLAMIVLPGPAIIVIPAGLGILATEFIWARNLLSKIHNKRNVKGGSYAKEAE
jgi:tellurite resistance protein TerC